jgi:DNA-directed RNA polymerase specialized sigma subunit
LRIEEVGQCRVSANAEFSQQRVPSTRSSESTAFITSFHKDVVLHIITLREKIDALPEDRRKRVEELADALIAEEMTLRDLRKARNQTQARVAQTLGINQENVSRIEQRSDLLISTLSGYVEAMGGKLHLVAEFPDRPPIALTGIAALDE